jgi:hypothetical protein
VRRSSTTTASATPPGAPAGFALTGLGSCDPSSVAANRKVSFGYEARGCITSASNGHGSLDMTRPTFQAAPGCSMRAVLVDVAALVAPGKPGVNHPGFR